jgi:hypothetical protein
MMVDNTLKDESKPANRSESNPAVGVEVDNLVKNGQKANVVATSASC